MSSTLSVSPAWVIITVVATVCAVGYPFLLGGIARKKLAVGWKYFWFGVLVFLVFQVLTRLPLIAVLQNTVLAPFLRESLAFTWIWSVVLAVTAGLFEEGGRYVVLKGSLWRKYHWHHAWDEHGNKSHVCGDNGDNTWKLHDDGCSGHRNRVSHRRLRHQL